MFYRLERIHLNSAYYHQELKTIHEIAYKNYFKNKYVSSIKFIEEYHLQYNYI